MFKKISASVEYCKFQTEKLARTTKYYKWSDEHVWVLIPAYHGVVQVCWKGKMIYNSLKIHLHNIFYNSVFHVVILQGFWRTSILLLDSPIFEFLIIPCWLHVVSAQPILRHHENWVTVDPVNIATYLRWIHSDFLLSFRKIWPILDLLFISGLHLSPNINI